jgi:imidazoleglycerol-phosphate dehydratase
VERRTKETLISVTVNLDGSGKSVVNTGFTFFNHMITSLSSHSLIDIQLQAKGDLKHHLVEDVAICLGEALNKALGSRKGIVRFGFSIVPMDCSLAIASLDLVKRPFYALNLKLRTKKIEDMMTEDIMHFLQTFSNSIHANVHIMVQYGSNDHHKIEAAFKALALSLRKAISLDMKRKNFPSSKGVM